jgi:hypothetical protein
MDTSFWVQYNPKIQITHTTKKYFGRYLYKLVVYAPAGRLIDSKDSIAEALEHRRTITKSVNYGGWWGHRYSKDLDHADVEFLTRLQEIRNDRTLGLKLRVEEPRIQIYAESVDKLENLVNVHFGTNWNTFVESISGPADDQAETVLNSGAIIRKTDTGYRYKIIIRDGRYSPEIKNNLLTYLSNLDPADVKLPGSGREMLVKSNGFIWNMYLYVNDADIADFLNLIHPGIVSNCHELVVMTDK